MLDFWRLWVVARFELAEALRSRLVAFLFLLFGGGAALGSAAFLKTLSAVEEQARRTLAEDLHLGAQALPDDLVREQVMPFLAQFVSDEGMRQTLLEMPPLSIFFGMAALNSVGAFALATTTSSISGSVSNGTVRFLLVRCERLSWAIGKAAGLVLLLGLALGVSAMGAGVTGMLLQANFDMDTWLWLFRVALRAWVYGICYLGVFSGVALMTSSAMKARALSLLVWLGITVGDWILSLIESGGSATAGLLRKLSPGVYKYGLWSSDLATYAGSMGALLLIGCCSFALGHVLFARRDA